MIYFINREGFNIEKERVRYILLSPDVQCTEAHQFLKMTSPINIILSSVLKMLYILSLCFAKEAMFINNATRFENYGTTQLYSCLSTM